MPFAPTATSTASDTSTAPPQVTLAQVARLAGVSPATASRVVNRSARVSRHARGRVEDAVRRLGYGRPGEIVTAHCEPVIAAVIADNVPRVLSDSFYARLLAGICQESLDGRRLEVLIAGGSQWTMSAYLNGSADGVLLLDASGGHRLPACDAPVLLSGTPPEGVPHRGLDLGDRAGARMAVRHLFRTSRHTVATVAGPRRTGVGAARLAGYREAVAEAGAAELVGHGDLRPASGEAVMAALLQRRTDLDAVFVASDLMAVGVLRALSRAGRKVPNDVAVVGFGDMPVAERLRPRLTTVRQPLEEAGARMVRELLTLIGGSRPKRAPLASTRLVVRDSA